jgi:hypothetical protein
MMATLLADCNKSLTCLNTAEAVVFCRSRVGNKDMSSMARGSGDQPAIISDESGWLLEDLLNEMKRPVQKIDGAATGEDEEEVGKQARIARARRGLDLLRHGIGGTDDTLKRIYDNLGKAGVDASELDPERKRSAAQMEAVVGEAYKQGTLVIARKAYDDITHDAEDSHKYYGEDAECRKLLARLDWEEMDAALKKAGAGIDDLKKVVITTGGHDVIRMFTQYPDQIDRFVTAFNEAHPERQMSDRDRKILRSDPRLSEAIFANRIRDLIADGHTSVSELQGQSRELLDLVGYPRIGRAISDGIISVKRLEELSPRTLMDAASELQKGDSAAQSAEVAHLLGLDGNGTQRFIESVQAGSTHSVQPFPAGREIAKAAIPDPTILAR